ncbi:905_t:CDS:2, partial [Dentiscutata erythropus]
DREPPSGMDQQAFARLLTFEKAPGLIVPVTPSIDLPESPHYWIDHVKNTIAFFMNADDDNKRCALNSLREDVGNKYEEA